MSESRPLGITLIVILNWIGVVFGLIFGLLLVVLGSLAFGSTGSSNPLSALLAVFFVLLGPLIIGAGLLSLGLGIFGIFVCIGLWRGRNWARIIALIFSAIAILASLPTLFMGNLFNIVVILFYLVIGCYLLFNTSVQQFFSRNNTALSKKTVILLAGLMALILLASLFFTYKIMSFTSDVNSGLNNFKNQPSFRSDSCGNGICERMKEETRRNCPQDCQETTGGGYLQQPARETMVVGCEQRKKEPNIGLWCYHIVEKDASGGQSTQDACFASKEECVTEFQNVQKQYF